MRITPYEAWRQSGYRQDWLANKMEVHPTQLNHLLRGRRPWNEQSRARFTALIDIPEEAIDFTFPVKEVRRGLRHDFSGNASGA